MYHFCSKPVKIHHTQNKILTLDHSLRLCNVRLTNDYLVANTAPFLTSFFSILSGLAKLKNKMIPHFKGKNSKEISVLKKS